jgi:hypothetical protein
MHNRITSLVKPDFKDAMDELKDVYAELGFNFGLKTKGFTFKNEMLLGNFEVIKNSSMFDLK